MTPQSSAPETLVAKFPSGTRFKMAANPPPNAPAVVPAPNADLDELREFQKMIKLQMQYYMRGQIPEYRRRRDEGRLRGERARLKTGPIKKSPKDEVKPRVVHLMYDRADVAPGYLVRDNKEAADALRDRLSQQNRTKDVRLGDQAVVSENATADSLWKKAGNAANDLARRIGRNQGLDPPRLVKLLGAGGLGFVALFDTRIERDVQPWDVNFYICKGVLRDKVVSRQKPGRKAFRERRDYRVARSELVAEENTQIVSSHQRTST